MTSISLNDTKNSINVHRETPIVRERRHARAALQGVSEQSAVHQYKKSHAWREWHAWVIMLYQIRTSERVQFTSTS
jgi:hypothetical protein